MKDITLGNRSEETGLFNFVVGADGDVSFDDSEAHAVMTSVVEHRGTYFVNPNHGSELHTIRSLTSRTPSQAEAAVRDALVALEQADLIDPESTVVAASRSGSTLAVDVEWQSVAGQRGRERITL